MPFEQEFGILKGRLSLTTDRGTVKEKGSFSVTVYDQNNNRIEGCIVYLDGYENDYATTGTNGITYISAPEVKENTQININAFKGGYLAGENSIRVESLSNNFITEEWYPIVLSSIIVISAILFVRFRNSRTNKKKGNKVVKPIRHSTKKPIINKDNLIRKYDFKKPKSNKVNNNSIQYVKKEPWVEEIRLQRSVKKRETKVVGEKNKTSGSNIRRKDCDWFKGKNYMKYKIDELTGEIDDKNDGKWFEGIDEIKTKVDKRLRENKKPSHGE